MFYYVARGVVRVLLDFLFRTRVIDAGHVPREGPLVVCCNHRSLLDPPVIACYMKPKLRFMAKAELFKIPVFSAIIRACGAFPVNRGGMSMETMKTAIRQLKDGNNLLVFPEGTRQKSGVLGEGKKGAASLALRSGASILPVAIVGEYRLFRPFKVVFGKPFDAAESVAELPPAERGDALTKKIMDSIQDLIDRNSSSD